MQERDAAQKSTARARPWPGPCNGRSVRCETAKKPARNLLPALRDKDKLAEPARLYCNARAYARIAQKLHRRVESSNRPFPSYLVLLATKRPTHGTGERGRARPDRSLGRSRSQQGSDARLDGLKSVAMLYLDGLPWRHGYGRHSVNS